MHKAAVFLVLAVVAVGVGYYVLRGGDTPAGGAGQQAPAQVVRTGEVRMEPLTDHLEAMATTSALQDVDVTANIAGKVMAVYFKSGQQVAAGDVLVELDDAIPRARLREAEAIEREDRRLLEHYETLDKTQAVSRNVLEEQRARVDISKARVETARAELAEFTIRAPFSGFLGGRLVSTGALVSPGTVITTLDNLDVLRVDFTVPERWLSRLVRGQAVTASSVAWPGIVFDAEVTSIGPRVDPATRAVRVRAHMRNSDLRLRPGMLLDLALVSDPRSALVVSEKALMQEGSERYVYLVDNDDTVVRQAVTTGQRRYGLVEILDGLDVGQKVVTEGIQKVREGSTVRIDSKGDA